MVLDRGDSCYTTTTLVWWLDYIYATCCCHMFAWSECRLTDLHWWGFWGGASRGFSHSSCDANMMICTPFSPLKCRQETSWTLSRGHKWAFVCDPLCDVCVSRWWWDWKVEGNPYEQAVTRYHVVGGREHNGHLKEKVNNINPCLCCLFTNSFGPMTLKNPNTVRSLQRKIVQPDRSFQVNTTDVMVQPLLFVDLEFLMKRCTSHKSVLSNVLIPKCQISTLETKFDLLRILFSSFIELFFFFFFYHCHYHYYNNDHY